MYYFVSVKGLSSPHVFRSQVRRKVGDCVLVSFTNPVTRASNRAPGRVTSFVPKEEGEKLLAGDEREIMCGITEREYFMEQGIELWEVLKRKAREEGAS